MDRAGCVLRFRRAPACAAATVGHAGADPGGHARRAPPQILRGSARRRHHRCRCLVRTSLRPPHEPSAGNGRSPIACVATPFRKDYYAVWDRAGVDLADAIGAPVVVMSHFLPHDSATATAQQPSHPLLLASQFGPWADHALLQSAASCRSRSVSLTLCFAPMCASVGLCARLPFCPPVLCIFGRCAVSSHARVCRLERQKWCATAARPTDCACRRRGIGQPRSLRWRLRSGRRRWCNGGYAVCCCRSYSSPPRAGSPSRGPTARADAIGSPSTRAHHACAGEPTVRAPPEDGHDVRDTPPACNTCLAARRGMHAHSTVCHACTRKGLQVEPTRRRLHSRTELWARDACSVSDAAVLAPTASSAHACMCAHPSGRPGLAPARQWLRAAPWLVRASSARCSSARPSARPARPIPPAHPLTFRCCLQVVGPLWSVDTIRELSPPLQVPKPPPCLAASLAALHDELSRSRQWKSSCESATPPALWC